MQPYLIFRHPAHLFLLLHVCIPPPPLLTRALDDTQPDRYPNVAAVAFLQSMGLPEPMLTATRAQVEKGKIDFSSSLEYKMYSRHDKPAEQ